MNVLAEIHKGINSRFYGKIYALLFLFVGYYLLFSFSISVGIGILLVLSAYFHNLKNK